MKRNGFTLIELMVSIVLVTIVLASMSVALIKLKDTYNKTNDKTDIDIVSSSITRVIGNDIADNGGIRQAIKIDDTTLELFLKNGKRRTIKIENLDGYKTECLYNNNVDEPTSGASDNSDSLGTRRIDKSTLKYIDSTDDTEQILYIKTIDYTCHNNERKCKSKVIDEECTSTTGNKFIGMNLVEKNTYYIEDSSYDIVGSATPAELSIRLNDSKNDIVIPMILENKDMG